MDEDTHHDEEVMLAIAKRLYSLGTIDQLIQVELEILLTETVKQLEDYDKIPYNDVGPGKYCDIVDSVARCRACIHILRYYTTNDYYHIEQKVDDLAERMEAG